MARRRRSDDDNRNDDESSRRGDDGTNGEDADYVVPILRHETRIGGDGDETPVGEISTGDPEAIEQIAAHFERHVGRVDGVFHEIVSDLVHIDVHCIPATPKRPYWTLFTTGMSERPMTVPEGHGLEAFRYAELMICLPPEWPLFPEAFKDERNYWPILWLKRLARFPHEYKTWLFQDHTVPNGDPPAPFAPNTELCCLWLTPPFGVAEDFSPLALDDGRTIFFWSLVPLYQDEMEIKLRGGSSRLQAYLDKQRLTPDDLCVVDPERPRKRKRDLWRFRL